MSAPHCKVCGETRITQLSKYSRYPNGVRNICRGCWGACQKGWRATDGGTDYRKRTNARAQVKRRENVEAYRAAKARASKVYRSRPPDPLTHSFGQAVKAWRKANKLTQQQVADALGLQQASFSLRERGRTPWRPEERLKLERAGVRFWDDEVTA